MWFAHFENIVTWVIKLCGTGRSLLSPLTTWEAYTCLVILYKPHSSHFYALWLLMVLCFTQTEWCRQYSCHKVFSVYLALQYVSVVQLFLITVYYAWWTHWKLFTHNPVNWLLGHFQFGFYKPLHKGQVFVDCWLNKWLSVELLPQKVYLSLNRSFFKTHITLPSRYIRNSQAFHYKVTTCLPVSLNSHLYKKVWILYIVPGAYQPII